MTLNCEMALLLRYFNEFGSFRGKLRTGGWKSHNYGQFTITMSSVGEYLKYKYLKYYLGPSADVYY